MNVNDKNILNDTVTKDNVSKESFNYTYSAQQQEEVEAIRKKYLPTQETPEDKLEQLRKLDQQVTNKATMLSIIVGVVGALIMGTGMSLAMTDIGSYLVMSGNVGFVFGIVIGVIGMVVLGVAYPLYNKTLKEEREKIAPEI
ncbi:MAG: hypothetical protein IJZ96_07570, partial [Lachnospiraceae bacterium]|nr:hypothetical protein [Lachnospiraceae bacterium]